MTSYRMWIAGDRALERVAPGTFDNEIDLRWSAEFAADPRHHLAIALDGDLVVGMASAVHYVPPDKPPELWVNEVGVATDWRRRGIARELLKTLFAHARTLGCSQAWVLTEEDNVAARTLYEGAGGRERITMYVEFELEDPSA